MRGCRKHGNSPFRNAALAAAQRSVQRCGHRPCPCVRPGARRGCECPLASWAGLSLALMCLLLESLLVTTYAMIDAPAFVGSWVVLSCCSSLKKLWSHKSPTRGARPFYLLLVPLQGSVCYEQDKVPWGTEFRQTGFLLLSPASRVLSRPCSSFWVLVAWTPLTWLFCLSVLSCFNSGLSSKTYVASTSYYLWKKCPLNFV